MWPMAERGEWMMESEGDLAEELNSVEGMWERICEVLCSRPVSVDNRTKQTADMAMIREYSMYKCRVNCCELFLKFL